MTTNTATYCPEDNKLRLYVGRVPHDEYLALKAEGWTSTPKQDCDFAATWTPRRRDTCLDYAGIIEDEDMEPAERSADRAERFAEYREKRTAEAVGHANRYEATPLAHGYQNEQRAQRAAARHDRIAGYACDAWSKAEYWQRRTAGVIQHALYVSTPSVRMGRIKRLESEQRKRAEAVEQYKKRFRNWQQVAAIEDPKEQTAAAVHVANFCHGHHYRHPRPESATTYVREHGTSLYSLLTQENDPITGAEAAALWFKGQIDPESAEFEHTRIMQWTRHCELRLAYERQMLDAQGGRLASVEIEPGGYIGGKLVYKVNKSPKTKRVTSVSVLGPKVESWTYRATNIAGTEWAEYSIETERLSPDAYTPPTHESRAELKRIKAEVKQAQAPLKKSCPLINPTREDAERLQTLWNEKALADAKRHARVTLPEPSTVTEMTQAEYKRTSAGTYASAKTVHLDPGGLECRSRYYKVQTGDAVCKVRRMDSAGVSFYRADSVIVLTDKPQKPFPIALWHRETYQPDIAKLHEAIAAANGCGANEQQAKLLREADENGIVDCPSTHQANWTDEGRKLCTAFFARQRETANI
ncbi:DUF3560 domain-containing protein [Cerasicoccus fimbriatus]|uniref:DUF3560 domain-containing protein n=1 Tax=Cerasicoccus fimbriatus TaxID=3014554 RepID=UPI0022B476FE|nr:DUF3560 domain-containing protein [Cerasicoccus sp. TK19100]